MRNCLLDYKKLIFDYKKFISLFRAVPLTPTKEVREGGVYQLPADEPLFVAVINKEGDFLEVAPVSFCWPLATRHDLIVELPHPFSDTWIVQTDLISSAPVKILEGAELIGELSKGDLELLKALLRGERALPKNRRGRGYDDLVHREFKDFEYRRYRKLIGQLLEEVEVCEEAEEEEVSLSRLKELANKGRLPKFLRAYLREIES